MTEDNMQPKSDQPKSDQAKPDQQNADQQNADQSSAGMPKSGQQNADRDAQQNGDAKQNVPPVDAAENTAASTESLAEDALGDSVLFELAAERDSFREMAQRLQADFENFKKRTVKSDQERIARAEENLVQSLLPTLDAIDLAIAHDPENESVKQIQSSLLDALRKSGMTRVGAVDEPFDPNLHEAVMHEEGDGDHHILEIFRAGYIWKGRVIRPAMVKVAGA